MALSGIKNLATRLVRSSILSGHIARLDQQSSERYLTWVSDNSNSFFSKAITVLVVFLIGGLFAYNLQTFSRWPPPPYKDPSVFNLTAAGVIWDTHYGDSASCGSLDCHLTTEYESSAFERRQVLPVSEFPLVGYEAGQNIYYRTKVKIPEHLLDATKSTTLVFHALFVWGKHFEIYFNERLISTGSMDLVHLPISRFDIDRNGEIAIAIKVVPGNSEYQGVANFGAIAIGEERAMAPLKHIARDHGITYFLWLVLPRLSFAFFFGFIFLAFSRNRENYHFLFFSALVSAKVVFQSDLLAEILPSWAPRIMLAVACDATSQIVLAFFFLRYFRRNTRKTTILVTCAAVGAAGYCAVAWMTDGFVGVHPALRLAALSLRTVTLVLGLSLALEAALFLMVTGMSPLRLKVAIAMVILISGTLGIWAMEAMVHVFSWMPKSYLLYSGLLAHVSEMLLLFVLAAAVAAEFGFSFGQKEKTVSALRTYVGPSVATKIMSSAEGLGPEERQVTVMFTDIRSFTTLSESLPPLVIVESLNEYFQSVVPIVERYGGSVDKFIGDSIMAVWGATGAQAEGPELAARCAIEMRRALIAMNESRRERGLFPLMVGVGLHCGSVVAGSLGSSGRKEFTIIGDAVNLAARIQDETRRSEFDILISGSLYEAIKESALAQFWMNRAVKGKAIEVALYRLIGMLDSGSWLFGHDGVLSALAAKTPLVPEALTLDESEVAALSALVWPDNAYPIQSPPQKIA